MRRSKSPLDRRACSVKTRHVGDRVAAVVAENEAIALESIIVNRSRIRRAETGFWSIDEAKADGAPLVHDEPVIMLARRAG